MEHPQIPHTCTCIYTTVRTQTDRQSTDDAAQDTINSDREALREEATYQNYMSNCHHLSYSLSAKTELSLAVYIYQHILGTSCEDFNKSLLVLVVFLLVLILASLFIIVPCASSR